jgi:hypothetical protein
MAFELAAVYATAAKLVVKLRVTKPVPASVIDEWFNVSPTEVVGAAILKLQKPFALPLTTY